MGRKNRMQRLHRQAAKNGDESSPGVCQLGDCGQEAACRILPNNTAICVCPHDNSTAHPPHFHCPRRTVSMTPHVITDIIPPRLSNNNNTEITAPMSSTEKPAMKHEKLPPDHALLFGVSGLVLIVFLLFATCLYKRRKSVKNAEKASHTPSPLVLKQSLIEGDRYTPNPQYSACTTTTVPLIRRDGLKFIQEIGEGCFGKVFKGELVEDGSDYAEVVAIKVLKETASREAEDDFMREVEIMSAFRHPNILSLVGMVPRETRASPMMVFEYMSLGDLAEVLRIQGRHPEVPSLGQKELLAVARQVSAGMRYLSAQRFVHRDLACRNCLVSAGLTVKIADFGMSRDVYTCDYYKIGGSRLLPVRWMSPESVVYGKFTLESDVWSFGVVLWEIYSLGKQPYYGHTNEEVVRLILQGIMLIPPDDCPPIVCDLMRSCWKTEPAHRIRFTEIDERLQRALDAVETKKWSAETLPRPPAAVPAKLLDADGYLVPTDNPRKPDYLETISD